MVSRKYYISICGNITQVLLEYNYTKYHNRQAYI